MVKERSLDVKRPVLFYSRDEAFYLSRAFARKLIHFQRQSGCGFCKGQMTDERRNDFIS